MEKRVVVCDALLCAQVLYCVQVCSRRHTSHTLSLQIIKIPVPVSRHESVAVKCSTTTWTMRRQNEHPTNYYVRKICRRFQFYRFATFHSFFWLRAFVSWLFLVSWIGNWTKFVFSLLISAPFTESYEIKPLRKPNMFIISNRINHVRRKVQVAQLEIQLVM